MSRTTTDESDADRTFELSCTDCAFTSRVDGDVDDIYDVIEGHRERMENAPSEHFVDFQAVSA